MFSPYMLIGALVGAILLAATSFGAGIKLEGDHRDALQLQAEKTAEAKVKAEQDKAQLAATQLEQTRAQLAARQQIITRTLTKIVTRKVYASACFDPDGLELANQALTGVSDGSKALPTSKRAVRGSLPAKKP